MNADLKICVALAVVLVAVIIAVPLYQIHSIHQDDKYYAELEAQRHCDIAAEAGVAIDLCGKTFGCVTTEAEVEKAIHYGRLCKASTDQKGDTK